jgi:predicted enzyme related to lactoylglutathione lyase
MANHPGDFIWYELMSPDARASEAFYGPLLDWRFGGGADYREIQGSDGGVGGFLQLTPDMTAGGARPAWVGYVLVDDVDAAIASVANGGGRVYMPARTMDGVGRFAMVADPQGAPFYVMKPTPPANAPDQESHAYSYDRPRLGHCAWNELATRDPAAALRFYGERFGWVKDGEMEMGPLGAYEFLRHAGRAPDGSPPGHGMLGAMMKSPPGAPPAFWTFYFRVSDVDAAVAHVDAHGGRVVRPPMQIPGGDYSLIAVDPHGASFGLVGARRA